MVIIYHLKSTATTSGTDQFDFGNPFWPRYRSEEISPLAPLMVWFGLLTVGARVAIPVAVINYPLMHTNGDPGQRPGRT